ncbi:MAG: bifunctional hydroxymethylpyrimidine kinase/phosphomethylpyrimidine kinase [Planctomycetes bacterium]|nr:bifunctional hydroxymethylpyrimidine kinase/phosphomethylpyrimidine kinase [Planctomycetota bacterium]
MTSVNKARLIEIVKNLSTARVGVIGDFVLDRFIYGHSTRISREAPVLILKEHCRTELPGGGANTLNNCLSLGIHAHALTVVGKDPEGEALKSILYDNGMKPENSEFIMSDNASTTTKSRILGGLRHSTAQQIVRVDREMPLQPDESVDRGIIECLRKMQENIDVLIIADYGLGVISEPVKVFIKENIIPSGIKVLVDSRFGMLGYEGFYGITPNITEVEDVLGEDIGNEIEKIERLGRELRATLNLNILVITRGKFGMTLIEETDISHIPCFGRDEVADVTGAGDTVIAVLASALAAGATSLEASHISNIAGGLVVQKQGTATLTREELLKAIATIS